MSVIGPRLARHRPRTDLRTREPDLNTLLPPPAKTSLPQQVLLGDQEFDALRQLIHQLAGIQLSDAKKPLVHGRLHHRVRELGMSSFTDYYRMLVAPQQAGERQLLIDLLTTNETYFFREPRHFEVLRNEILPARDPQRRFRVWSAACSSGEEAWSLAMVLADACGTRNPATWEVLGSDISQRVLAKARAGIYPARRIEAVPRALLRQYAELDGSGSAATLAIATALRERVRFERINLNERLPSVGRFDLVFLRNMLIYFQGETRTAIVRRLVDVLEPGGWLVVGHSESLKATDARLASHSPSIYRVNP